jgi:MFS family permease
MKEGIDALRGSRGLMLAFGQVSIAVLVLFMLFALAPAYVSNVLGIAPQDSYVILGPATGGAILSAILLGQFVRNIDRSRLLIGSLIANGITMLALAAVPQAMNQLPDLRVHSRITGAAFSLILGIEFGAIMIPAITYLMETTSDEIRGRIFALLYMVINGVTALPVLAAAALSDTIGTAHVIGGLGALLIFGGVGVLIAGRRATYRNEHYQHQTTEPKSPEDRGDQRQVVAQQVAREPDGDRPAERTKRAEHLKAPERHSRHPGEHRTPGAQAEDETAGEDGLVAVAREEQLGARDVVGADAK